MKIKLLLLSLVSFFFSTVFYTTNVSAATQCDVDGGVCLTALFCQANCGHCDTYEFRNQAVGYYMCGIGTNNGKVCCDGVGYPGFCNSQPYIQGTGANACYYTGWNNQSPYDTYFTAPGGGSCESSSNPDPSNPSYASCPNCNSGGVCDGSTCNAQNTVGTNHCGYTSGSMQCHYTTSTLEDNSRNDNYCNRINYTAGCQTFWNNCQAPFACIGNNTCEKTMGGKITDADTGAGIPGISIAGDVTDANGNWTVNNGTNNMAYNAAFSFTAPSGAAAAPCNAGFICSGSGNTSPNPNTRSGTVGGGGDCGTNCNFVYTPGKISGHVWIDANHNGVQDGGEVNAGAGILVQADTGGTGLYTYTDASGNYTLNYLNTGSHTVDIHDFPGYKVITNAQTVSIPPNAVNINFGIAPAYSVSGYTFTDWNYNNNFDAEDNSYIPPPAVNVIEKDSTNTNTIATIPVRSDAAMTLTNASFETGGIPPSGWNFNSVSPAVATVSQDCTTAQSGNCSAHVNVSTAAPATYWYVNLYQPNISLTANTAYEVTFYAKASAARSIYFYLQQAPEPWVGYTSYHPTLTTSWAQYRFVFTSDYTDAATNLEFEFGEATGDVWIDNVSIRPMSYTVPKLYPGTYNATLNPMPTDTIQSPPVPNPVTISNADIKYENLGISPMYSITGNVYTDLNKDACWTPAYDPLYTGGGTITMTDSNNNAQTFAVSGGGTYTTGKVLHAGTWNVTYAIPTPYVATWPPVGFNVTVGNPAKSLACDVTLAQNPVCW